MTRPPRPLLLLGGARGGGVAGGFPPESKVTTGGVGCPTQQPADGPLPSRLFRGGFASHLLGEG